MRIVVGSESTLKLSAVGKACKVLGISADVRGKKTKSGQDEQPCGLAATLDGAATRAKRALADSDADVSVGIENGLFFPHNNEGSYAKSAFDFACIVVMTRDGRVIITTTPAVWFPSNHVEAAEKRGFKTTTVGSVIAEANPGSDPADPHTIVTKGKVTREDTLVAGLVIALKQL